MFTTVLRLGFKPGLKWEYCENQELLPQLKAWTITEVKTGKEPQEGVDFYVENGLLVFTSAYHLKRGFCCNNGCRHCPYKNKKSKPKS